MNNDNKVETAKAGLNCWASYATVSPSNKELLCYCAHTTEHYGRLNEIIPLQKFVYNTKL